MTSLANPESGYDAGPDRGEETREFSQQGAVTSAAGVHYRTWAPKAVKMTVRILSPAGTILREVKLSAANDGYFHGLDDLGQAGDLYRYTLDGGVGLPDPASRWQPAGVHGPSMVVDPAAFYWQRPDWKRPEFRDLVIYEMHVGTFTAEGVSAFVPRGLAG